jgi:Ser/Thr protein kinase RdoA (MazF antagonist)
MRKEDAMFAVNYSILSAQALAKQISLDYGLPVAWMKFYSSGFNDTYQLACEDGTRYYYRVYRRLWRTLDDILYEVDALNHLASKQFPAIRVIRRIDGSQLGEYKAPEGVRYGVLFSEARGALITYDTDMENKAFQYGTAEATMHTAMEDFHSPHHRRPLDLPFLTESILENAQPFLVRRPDDWEFLAAFSQQVRDALLGLPASELPQGFCHGDLQAYHCNVDEHGQMTFFDFDCSGPGYLAYDLAVFRWCGHLDGEEEKRWEPFLRGYQSIRPLTDLELASIPLFTACRYLWHISVHTLNAPDWGIGWLDDRYFDNRLKTLRQVQAELF